MRQHFDICGDYQASNPFLQREPFKHTFMKYAFLAYKKIRVSISKYIPLTEWQQYIWGDDNLDFRVSDNSASKCINDDEAPYFLIRHITVLELIPKENWNKLLNGIKHFLFKHADGRRIIDSDISSKNQFSNFEEGASFLHLGAMRIKDSSVLKSYVSQIIFHAINLSSSFFCLKITLELNEELKNRLSEYVICNVPDQVRLTGFENKHWYDFRYLANGSFSGSMHKCHTFENILKDITWNVMKEIQKFIPQMFFTAQKSCPRYVCSIATNIEGNANKDFWQSIGVSSRRCDFSPDLTSCIAWRPQGEPLFIFLAPQKAEQTVKTDIESFHIGDSLCYYLLYEKTSEHIRNRLSIFSNNINSTKKSLKSWLKLKVQFDAEMFYPIRFLNEIQRVEGISFPYITFQPNRTTIISASYFALFESIQRTTTLYKEISELFQSNIDYKNAKNNFSMQNKALIASVLAVTVSILSIFITVVIAFVTNENFAMQLCKLIKILRDCLSFA